MIFREKGRGGWDRNQIIHLLRSLTQTHTDTHTHNYVLVQSNVFERESSEVRKERKGREERGGDKIMIVSQEMCPMRMAACQSLPEALQGPITVR